MRCSWSASNAYTYFVGISTSPGINPLIQVNTSPYDFSNLTVDQTYYCNVKARGKAGDSAVKSSSGVYFEQAIGAINSYYPYAGSYYSGYVQAWGSFSGTPISNLRVRYSVKRSDNGYYLRPGGSWAAGQYFIITTLTSTGGGTFSMYSLEGGVDSAFDVNITWELYHIGSNRVLSTKNVTVNNNW